MHTHIHPMHSFRPSRMTERHTAVKERGMDTAALTAGGLAPLLAPLMAKAEVRGKVKEEVEL